VVYIHNLRYFLNAIMTYLYERLSSGRLPCEEKLLISYKISLAVQRRAVLKSDHFRQHKEVQNLSSLKIAHYNTTIFNYFKLSFM
jgi:hypothetical protein